MYLFETFQIYLFGSFKMYLFETAKIYLFKTFLMYLFEKFQMYLFETDKMYLFQKSIYACCSFSTTCLLNCFQVIVMSYSLSLHIRSISIYQMRLKTPKGTGPRD